MEGGAAGKAMTGGVLVVFASQRLATHWEADGSAGMVMVMGPGVGTSFLPAPVPSFPAAAFARVLCPAVESFVARVDCTSLTTPLRCCAQEASRGKPNVRTGACRCWAYLLASAAAAVGDDDLLALAARSTAVRHSLGCIMAFKLAALDSAMLELLKLFRTSCNSSSQSSVALPQELQLALAVGCVSGLEAEADAEVFEGTLEPVPWAGL